MANCAFYVAQGMVVAQRFAMAMGMNTNRFLNVIYPFADATAFCWNQFSGIGKSSFNKFDTLTHEYGHFVEDVMGTYGSSLLDIVLNNPNHAANTDHFYDKDNKSFAMDLTWSEAWATAFAQIAQSYYLSEYVNKVDGFGDRLSHNYSCEDFSFNQQSNEAQEFAVIAFLWDLYDSYSAAETYDNVGLGYSAWWNATTKSGTTTLTKFVDIVESYYPQYRSQIGEIMGAHQIAPSNLTVVNASSLSVSAPPKLSWKVNGSKNNPNDRFQVVFYDASGNQKYATANISDNSK
jgi:hypothetical protein